MDSELSLILKQRFIANARLINDPFQYLWIQNFFPEDIYAQIIAELKSFNPRGKQNYEKPDSGIEVYDSPTSKLFNEIKTALSEPTFSETIFAYFKTPPFSKLEVTLNRDFLVKYLSPILDSNPQKLTLQIYLPPDYAQQDQGVVLGRKEKGIFTPVTQLPFFPNSAYAFLSGERTWHSNPIFNNAPGNPRYSLTYRWKKSLLK